MGSYLSAPSGDRSDAEYSTHAVDRGRHPNRPHIPTERDVQIVQEIFLQFMPLELVNIVLDEAEYWPALICHAGSTPTRSIHAFHYPQHCAKYCYFISPRIPGFSLMSRGPLRVRKLKFRLRSYDQGYGGDPGLTEPYAGSWTWFEAAIIRGLGGDDSVEDPDAVARSIQQSPGSAGTDSGPEDPITDRGYGGALQITNPGSGVGSNAWHLQRNLRASRVEKLHEIIWTDNDGVAQNEGVINEMLDKTGKGPGYGFVRELVAGDRIAVYARAQYPGWVNNIRGVEIQIYYSM